jgi:beta-glucosidase
VPNDALYPFGYGLSYTTFAYSGVHVSRNTVPLAKANRTDARNLVTVTATVKNTGKREGTEVAQLYVRNLGASVEQPVRSLKGFTRVTLKPGESRQVTFQLGFPELSFWNVKSRQVVEPTHYTVWVGGSSLASQRAGFIVSP